MGSDCYGRGGEDLTIRVPVGTLVYDNATGDLLEDLNEDGKEILIARGGKGGIGNMHFATSTNRAPRIATPGTPGEAREIKLELRVLADVGLLGLPNAGKSSFLKTVSRASPKVADYPFTTLEPHLGVVEHKGQSIVIADLPGLIEGASTGAGLGHKFLRHVSRNRLLLHLTDISVPTEEILSAVKIIRTELSAYDAQLGRREQVLVFTKIDLMPDEELSAKVEELRQAGLEGFCISSMTSSGIGRLLDFLAERSQSWKKAAAASSSESDVKPAAAEAAEGSAEPDDANLPHVP
jgi:GTP-binding protein